MALTTTTLSAAAAAGDLTIAVASATGISYSLTAPVLLMIDDEFLVISNTVNGTVVPVSRGRNGSRAQAHGSGRTVYIGTPADFQLAGLGYNSDGITKFFSGAAMPTTHPATLTTAGALTYTPGQVLGGIVLRDPNGAARTDTLPTAALLVAAIPGVMIGSSFRFWVRNDADAAETITIAAGTGGTISGTATIAQSNSKEFLIRITGTAPGSEAYTAYSLGTVVF
jgi:hypothetical protein